MERRRSDARSVSHRVIEAVATERAVPATDLDPLYDTIDPDCLDALFPADAHGYRELTFTYHGHLVTVRADGDVAVEPIDTGRSSTEDPTPQADPESTD